MLHDAASCRGRDCVLRLVSGSDRKRGSEPCSSFGVSSGHVSDDADDEQEGGRLMDV